jgi:glycosidase
MRIRAILSIGISIILIASLNLFGQSDSVDVTFYYTPTGTPERVFVPGEFNGWGPNSNGVISAGAPSEMTFDSLSGRWYKTVRLRVGGHINGGVSGAYQYKFNINGSSTGWLSDPLNPRENPLDNNNSILYVKDPTIYHLTPNQKSAIVTTRRPVIESYIFPSTGTTVDTSGIILDLNGIVYDNLGIYFDSLTSKFSYPVPDPLASGLYTLKLSFASENGSVNSDSTEFIVEAGSVRILNRSNDNYIRPDIQIDGVVEDTTVTDAILHITTDLGNIATPVSVQNGRFSAVVDLVEGGNTIYAEVTGDDDNVSDTVNIRYVIDRRPRPVVTGVVEGDNIVLSIEELLDEEYRYVMGYEWFPDEEANPGFINISGTGESVSFPISDIPGEYYIDIRAVNFILVDIFPDPDEPHSGVDFDGTWESTARTSFIIDEAGSVIFPGTAHNPSWVDGAIVYEIYIPAFAANGAGNFQHVINRLPELKDLGINVIWFTPIYNNNESINTLNAGYNIADFYSVHPQFGTMSTFESLVAQAQESGLRIILDSTPNHLGGLHPWLNDISLYRDYSNYRPIVETRLLGSSRDLGHEIVYLDGSYPFYARYSNWTLANLNYQNPETVHYMLEMYKWWLLEKNIDGFRMDVYWGIENRYGKDAWWKPFREEIKRVKPDVFIIGETDGTGPGSENNYADTGGASDAAYDWNLYGTIRSILNASGSISDLHNRVNNYAPAGEPYSYYTGLNAHYFRFIENHDETRIAQLYGIARSRAGAVLNFTVPGIPLVYAGQEVGETSQRGTINWTRQGGAELREYYKRLTYGRTEFPAFTTKYIRQISSGHSRVYSFSRPYEDQNAIVAVNFSANNAVATLSIGNNHVSLSSDSLLNEKVYYLNDILNDSTATVYKTDLSSYSVTLGPWESVVYILADSAIRLVTSTPRDYIKAIPQSFSLEQNYPNPFNPATTIRFSIPQSGRVLLTVYDVLGREVGTLVDGYLEAGTYTEHFDASHLGSGLYFYRIESGDFVKVNRMVLVK